MRRQHLRSTIMPSNRPIEERGKLLSDVPSATAILESFFSQWRSFRSRGQPIDSRTASGGREHPFPAKRYDDPTPIQ